MAIKIKCRHCGEIDIDLSTDIGKLISQRDSLQKEKEYYNFSDLTREEDSRIRDKYRSYYENVHNKWMEEIESLKTENLKLRKNLKKTYDETVVPFRSRISAKDKKLSELKSKYYKLLRKNLES